MTWDFGANRTTILHDVTVPRAMTCFPCRARCVSVPCFFSCLMLCLSLLWFEPRVHESCPVLLVCLLCSASRVSCAVSILPCPASLPRPLYHVPCPVFLLPCSASILPVSSFRAVSPVPYSASRVRFHLPHTCVRGLMSLSCVPCFRPVSLVSCPSLSRVSYLVLSVLLACMPSDM